MKTRTILAVAVLGLAATANARTMIQPAAASTTLGGWGYDINWTINQSGLDYNYVSGVTDFDAFVSTIGHGGGWGWGFTGPESENPSGTVDLDLGAECRIVAMALWDGQAAAGNYGMIASFNLYAGNSDYSSLTLLGNYSGINAPANPLAQVFAFGATTTRYVRIEILAFHPGNISIGEIAFGTATVPAPAATALLGMGGMMGLRRRRR